jgi:hypothetical protein
MFDYILLAFFAAYLGLKFAQTKATGYLWFLLPLLLVVGLNAGWANHFGEAFFVVYRIATILSCALAGYMYYRDYHNGKLMLLLKIPRNAKLRKKNIVHSSQPKQQHRNLHKIQTQTRRKRSKNSFMMDERSEQIPVSFFILTITIRQISHTIGFIIVLSLVEQMRGADCDDLFR